MSTYNMTLNDMFLEMNFKLWSTLEWNILDPLLLVQSLSLKPQKLFLKVSLLVLKFLLMIIYKLIEPVGFDLL